MNRPSGSGMTVVEVTVAIFVLSVIATAVTGLIAAGDRLRGRGHQLTVATRMAQNEVERVERLSTRGEVISDTSYVDSTGTFSLEVTREMLNGNDTRLARPVVAQTAKVVPVEIRVGIPQAPAPLARFRFLVTAGEAEVQ